MWQQNNTTEKGFTLIELIISLSVFSVVVVLLMSSVTVMSNAQSIAITDKEAIDAAQSLMETILRDARFGTNFVCNDSGGDCVLGSSYLTFNSVYYGDNLTYQLSGETAERIDDVGNTVVLTAPNIHVTKLQFFASNLTDPTLVPRITVIMSLYADGGRIVSKSIDIETTISARNSSI